MKVTPYFGNVYVDHFKEDLKDIQEHGFDAILHPVSEFDLEYRSENIKELIYETKEAGFTCWVDPHGIGNLFGYGNYSNLLAGKPESRMVNKLGETEKRICPRSYEFTTLMFQWVELVKEADWVLYDEPVISECFCGKCKKKPSIPMVEFLTYIAHTLKAYDIKTSTCFWGGRIHPDTMDIAKIVDDVGVSIAPEYYDNVAHTQMWLSYIKSLAAMGEKSSSVWFPGYNIKSGEEDKIIDSYNLAKSHNIDNIATWGYRGCEGWSYAACENPIRMWEAIGVAFGS